jgi:type IV pilus assembly protein PilN
MIKINLLAAERKAVKTKLPFQVGQKLTVACSLILVATALVIGWRYWDLGRESARIDQEISAAQQETTRLHTIIQQVQQFEQRRAQLQQRVALIEELRRNQAGPVHMLDQISRALPSMLWLTEVKQSPDPNEVLIDGRATSLTSLSDFVANLEASGYFKRSVEIVSTQSELGAGPQGELIRFSIKAMFQQAGAKPIAAAPAAALATTPAAAPATAPANTGH